MIHQLIARDADPVRVDLPPFPIPASTASSEFDKGEGGKEDGSQSGNTVHNIRWRFMIELLSMVLRKRQFCVYSSPISCQARRESGK